MINLVVPSRYQVNKTDLRTRVESLFVEKHIHPKAILNIVFVGTRKMREIARTYKNEDEALPVLAFPYKELDTDGEQFLGEVFICYPQTILLAAEKSRRVDDMIFRLVEHGFNNILKDTSTPLNG